MSLDLNIKLFTNTLFYYHNYKTTSFPFLHFNFYTDNGDRFSGRKKNDHVSSCFMISTFETQIFFIFINSLFI